MALGSKTTTITIIWLLLAGLLAAAVEAANVTTRFSFFHASDDGDGATVQRTLATERDALSSVGVDFVVVTTANTTTAREVELDSSIKGAYTAIGQGHVLYRTQSWESMRDLSTNGSVWSRLKSTVEPTTYACVVVVHVTKMPDDEAAANAALVALARRVDGFCGAEDVLLVGFTAPLPTTFARFLESKASINGTNVPRTMLESIELATPANGSVGMVPDQAKNRVFVHSPVSSEVCVQEAVVAGVSSTTSLRMKMCIGEGCGKCDSSGLHQVEPTPSGPNGRKHGLVVLLSCGSFLLGCGVVFHLLFRKKFFMSSSEPSKQEKEVTTNLAYVLRI